MQARVKKDSRYGSITAFSGLEFVKTEWRPVPVGKEKEAERNPYLELDRPEPEAVKEPEQQPSLEEMQGIKEEPEPEAEVTEESKPKKPVAKKKG